jgi:Lrp/AsnC family transcriptional regulator for asnA, asnC and gidA
MIDELDKRLIEELQQDGRAVFVDLAHKLGVSEGTIRKRVRRLVTDKVMRVVAVPNLPKLGCGFLAMMGIQVRVHELRKVADQLINNHHVCYVSFVTGRYDLMAIVMTESPEELSGFIEKEISAIPDILRTETFVSLDILKGEPSLLDTVDLVKSVELRPR